jgi:outer membrane protein assembly factor BamA
VVSGAQYKLTRIDLTNDRAIPADELRSLIHVNVGEPANAVEIQQDVQAIQKLYGSKGYLDARVTPIPEMDDSQSTVTYEIDVHEGDLYRMGDLQIDGIDDGTINRIMAQWQMKKGDPYDNTYVHRFFDLTYRDPSLHHSYSIIPKPKLNSQDKTVSIALHFVPK